MLFKYAFQENKLLFFLNNIKRLLKFSFMTESEYKLIIIVSIILNSYSLYYII